MKSWLIFAVLVMVLVVVGGYYTLKPEPLPQDPLVVNMRMAPIRTDLLPGQLLMYDVAVRTTRQTQVRVVSDLFSTEKQQSYFSIPDAFNFSKNVTKRYKISLPSAVVPGNYELRVLLQYGEKKILATAPVRVKQAQQAPITTSAPIVKTNATSPTAQGNVTGVASSNQTSPQTTAKPTITPTLLEVPQDIKTTCPEEQLDDCVLDASIQKNQSSLCNAILEQNTRDNCLIHFVENGEIALCPYIAFPEFKEYCDALTAAEKGAVEAKGLPELRYEIEIIEGEVD